MTPAEIETYVDAASAALGIRLQPEQRPGVLRFFALAAEFAAVVDAAPLGMYHESAMSFEPVAPAEKQA